MAGLFRRQENPQIDINKLSPPERRALAGQVDSLQSAHMDALARYNVRGWEHMNDPEPRISLPVLAADATEADRKAVSLLRTLVHEGFNIDSSELSKLQSRLTEKK